MARKRKANRLNHFLDVMLFMMIMYFSSNVTLSRIRALIVLIIFFDVNTEEI